MKKGSQIKPIRLVRKKPLKELSRNERVQMTQQAKRRLADDIQNFTVNVMRTAQAIAKEAGRRRVTEDDIVLAKMTEQSLYDKPTLRSEFKLHYERTGKKKNQKKK